MNLDEINIRVKDCFEVYGGYNWMLKPRTNPYHKLIFIRENGGQFTLDGNTVRTKRGHLIYSFPGLKHSAQSSEQETLNYWAIHFWIYKIRFEQGRGLCFEEIKFPFPIDNIISLNNYQAIHSVVERIVYLWLKKEPGYQMQATSLLGPLLQQILSDIHYCDITSNRFDALQKSIQYIKQNYAEKISIDQLVNETGLSRAYFQREFKKLTGYTVTNFIRLHRIEKAKEYLVKTSKPIKEIGQLVGYDDEFYFSRVFKNMEHVSPTNYRQYY